MWYIHNPTNVDIKDHIIGQNQKWSLLAGESKKFPNEIGSELVKIFGFLEVVKKDEVKPKVEFKKPSLDKFTDAEPDFEPSDRTVKHVTSDKEAMSNTNFLPKSPEEQTIGSGNSMGNKFIKVRQSLVDGKLVSMDRDGVEWYGNGVELDNPFSKT